ncbi:MAG: hypothetical protein R2800_04125 [Flavipsychrobacter sp.]
MSSILLIILGIVALLASIFLFRQGSAYDNEAAEISKEKQGDTRLASQLYKSGTQLRMYAIGFVIVGLVLIGYYIKEVVL